MTKIIPSDKCDESVDGLRRIDSSARMARVATGSSPPPTLCHSTALKSTAMAMACHIWFDNYSVFQCVNPETHLYTAEAEGLVKRDGGDLCVSPIGKYIGLKFG